MMPVKVSQLRRWFAVAAVAAVLTVAGAYFYARHRVQNVLKQIPAKMPIGIQQSADGFSISGSDGPRTTYKIQASKAIQFQHGGRAELHDVAITLYGRDSGRFDQIYGSNFEYDPKSGDVAAKGEVQIDLEANPAGLAGADQATPVELKNPIHLKTSGLMFNQKTGNASTKERVDFKIAEASGSAVGVSYDSKSGALTLDSQISLNVTGATPASITAVHGTIQKDPRIIVFDQARVQSGNHQAQADHARLFLRPDNTLGRLLANGNVVVESQGLQNGTIHSAQLDIALASGRGTVHTAVFSGDVQLQGSGPRPMEGSAERLVLNFTGNNVPATARAENNVWLRERKDPSSTSAKPQDVELTAAAVDFFLFQGRRVDHAVTSGAAQVVIGPQTPASGQTLITAGHFEARFNRMGQLTTLHGAPDARIVSSNPGNPDRVSVSQTLDASFHPGKGIDSIVQQGALVYSDGDRQAWADRATYTPADQMLVLAGSPRVVQGGMTTTADTMQLNRATGDAESAGNVKSTYSDLKAQANGALLSSSSPIHVTANRMTLRRASSTALYSGGARLWQNANAISAPAIAFNRDRRSMMASGPSDTQVPGNLVSTVLIQTDKNGKATPVAITARLLTYVDDERKAHFEGNVIAKSADFTVFAGQMDVFLQARGQTDSAGRLANANPVMEGAAKLDRIVARNQVVISQTTRRATGEQLVYTSADDKFVLTGGPPSIFDAEHGKVTGDSLTLFRTDDRVLVVGSKTSPSVTQTRVAR